MALTTDLDAVAPDAAATAAFVLEPPHHQGLEATHLAAGKYLIGSADDCQIQLPVSGVSPHHALLIVGGRKTFLKAWDEKTWINDWPVKESVLRPGDRISIGPVTLRWRAVRADEIPPAPPRRIDDDAPLVQELAETAAVDLAAPLEQPTPPKLSQAPPPARTVTGDQQVLHARRLEELTRQLDARAESLQQEIERQTREWRDRDAAWSDERRRAEEEFAARERALLARRQEIETWESRLTSRENDLEDREAAWAANIAEIRTVWETTQREGETKIEAQFARLTAETAACEQRQVELDELEQSLSERDLALGEAERELEELQALAAAAPVVGLEEQNTAAREFEEGLAELDANRQSLAEAQAALAADRTEFDAERREFIVRLTGTDARQRQLDELQDRLRSDQDDLTAARREIQADRAAIDDERTALAREHAALVAERELLNEANAGGDEASFTAANDSLIAEQAALAEERTAWLAEQDDFESRQRAWQEQVEQQRLHTETIDRDLADRQQQLAAAQARLEEDRRELELKRADLDDAERKLQSTITERDGEIQEARRKQSTLDERLAEFEIEWEELTAAWLDLDAAREAWQVEEAASREELAGQSQAQQETEARLSEREAELQNASRKQAALHERLQKLAIDQEELTAAQLKLDADRDAWQQEAAVSRQELADQSQAQRDAAAQLAERAAAFQQQIESEASPANVGAEADEIARLTDELQREQEHRRTVESQLEGIRTRHERDADNWHSERTDWMVERDRLERELQAATRQLAMQKSKPVCIDVVPIDSVSPQDAVSVEDLVADRNRDHDSVTDDPQWDAPRQIAVAGDWQEQPISAEVAAEDVEPAAKDDPLNHVRAELAKMFDLSESSRATSYDESAEREEPPIAEPPRAVSVPPEPLAPAASDWESRLDALRRQAEIEASPPPPVAPPEPVHKPAAAKEEEDSIAAYMERMLARNRKSGDEPQSAPISQPTITVSRPVPVDSSLPSPVEPETSAAEPVEDLSAAPRRRSAMPRVAPDKNTAREHLQVFRQVANASARTAVAKHTSQRLWMTVAAKGIVVLVCASAAASFQYASTHQQLNYHWQSLGCAVLGLAAGLDLLRNLFRSRRSAAISKAPGRNTPSARADDDASPALDDEAVEEIAQDS